MRRRPKDQMLEKKIQEKGKEYGYETYGQFDHRKNPGGLLKVIKLTMLGMYGEGGWPDHFWMVRAKPVPKIFFIEVKRENEGCTEQQIERHLLLRAMGFDVYVAPGLTRYKQILDQAVARALGKKWKPGQEVGQA